MGGGGVGELRRRGDVGPGRWGGGEDRQSRVEVGSVEKKRNKMRSGECLQILPFLKANCHNMLLCRSWERNSRGRK